MTPYADVPSCIKIRLSLSTHVLAAGIELKKRGAEWVGLCPFHDENTPSFSINDTKGLYFCRGCRATGDIIEFHAAMNLVSTGQAIKELADLADIKVEPRQYTPRNGQAVRRPQRQAWDRSVLLDINVAAQYVFRGQAEHPNFISVVEERHIPPALAAAFGLGYFPNDLTFLDSMVARPELSDLSRDQVSLGCAELGLTYAGGGSPFTGRLIFPITDPSGAIVGFSGRTLDGANKAKYINSPESELFDKSRLLYALTPPRALITASPEARDFWRALAAQDEIYVVEGYTDVIALAAFGIRACAGMGTGFSSHQVQLLLKHARRIRCLYDGDRPGQQAAQRTMLAVFAEMTDDHRLTAHLLPVTHDPDSFLAANPDDPKAALSGLHVRQPESLWWDHYVGKLSTPSSLADQVVIERAYANRDTYPKTPLWQLMIARRIQQISGYLIRYPALQTQLPPWSVHRLARQALPNEDAIVRLWLHRLYARPDRIAALCAPYRRRWWANDLLTGRARADGPPAALTYIFAANVCLGDDDSIDQAGLVDRLLKNGFPAHWLMGWASTFTAVTAELAEEHEADPNLGDRTWQFEWSTWLDSMDESLCNRFKAALTRLDNH